MQRGRGRDHERRRPLHELERGVHQHQTASWRTAFLTSPGTPGSNFSYTTPVVPPGGYTVTVRGVDQHDQVTTPPAVRTRQGDPPGGQPALRSRSSPTPAQPGTAHGRRTSASSTVAPRPTRTHATLSYAWTYTLNGTSTGTAGPKPTRTFTARAPTRCQLIVTDEWGTPSAAVDPAGDDHRAGRQRRADAGDQPAGVQRPGLQLLRRRVGRPQPRRHVQLPGTSAT